MSIPVRLNGGEYMGQLPSTEEAGKLKRDFDCMTTDNEGLSEVARAANSLVRKHFQEVQDAFSVLSFTRGGAYTGNVNASSGFGMAPAGSFFPECVNVDQVGTHRWYQLRCPDRMTLVFLGEFVPRDRSALHFGVAIESDCQNIPRQFFHTYGTEHVKAFSRPIILFPDSSIRIDHDYRKTGLDYSGLIGVVFLRVNELLKSPRLLIEQHVIEFGPVNVPQPQVMSVVNHYDNSHTIDIRDSIVQRSTVGGKE